MERGVDEASDNDELQNSAAAARMASLAISAVEDLQLPPAVVLTLDTPLAQALQGASSRCSTQPVLDAERQEHIRDCTVAYERDFTILPLTSSGRSTPRRLVGWIDAPALRRAVEARAGRAPPAVRDDIGAREEEAEDELNVEEMTLGDWEKRQRASQGSKSKGADELEPPAAEATTAAERPTMPLRRFDKARKYTCASLCASLVTHSRLTHAPGVYTQ